MRSYLNRNSVLVFIALLITPFSLFGTTVDGSLLRGSVRGLYRNRQVTLRFGTRGPSITYKKGKGFNFGAGVPLVLEKDRRGSEANQTVTITSTSFDQACHFGRSRLTTEIFNFAKDASGNIKATTLPTQIICESVKPVNGLAVRGIVLRARDHGDTRFVPESFQMQFNQYPPITVTQNTFNFSENSIIIGESAEHPQIRILNNPNSRQVCRFTAYNNRFRQYLFDNVFHDRKAGPPPPGLSGNGFTTLNQRVSADGLTFVFNVVGPVFNLRPMIFANFQILLPSNNVPGPDNGPGGNDRGRGHPIVVECED